MKTIELGRTGEKLGAVALGCMTFGTTTPRDEAFAMLDAYLEAGGRFLDTAHRSTLSELNQRWAGKGE